MPEEHPCFDCGIERELPRFAMAPDGRTLLPVCAVCKAIRESVDRPHFREAHYLWEREQMQKAALIRGDI